MMNIILSLEQITDLFRVRLGPFFYILARSVSKATIVSSMH